MTTVYLPNETILSVVDKSEGFPDNVTIGNVEERMCLSYGSLFQCTGMDMALHCKNDAAAQWLVDAIASAILLDKKIVELKPFQGE